MRARPAGEASGQVRLADSRRVGRAFTAVIGVVAVVCLLVAGGLRLPGLSTATGRRTDPVTSLYFDRPTALPIEHRSGEGVSFAWWIRNDEGAERTYRFQVIVRAVAGQRLVTSGTVTVRDHRASRQVTLVAPMFLAARSRVTVQLVGRQDIAFTTAPVASS